MEIGKKLYKILRVGGRSFYIYMEYDEQLEESYPCFPDFEELPEYTAEGYPFATAEQDICSYVKAHIPGEPLPSDCGGCGWFYREYTPCDLIGICMCDARRKRPL